MSRLTTKQRRAAARRHAKYRPLYVPSLVLGYGHTYTLGPIHHLHVERLDLTGPHTTWLN